MLRLRIIVILLLAFAVAAWLEAPLQAKDKKGYAPPKLVSANQYPAHDPPNGSTMRASGEENVSGCNLDHPSQCRGTAEIRYKSDGLCSAQHHSPLPLAAV